MMPAPRTTVPMHLDTLLAGVADVPADVPVADITLDSREVRTGALFIALRGNRTHGLEYLDDALQRGATAVAWEPAPGVTPPVLPAGVHGVAVPLLRERLGTVADRFFGSPSKSVATAAVTGTNGKTTVAWLVAGALEHLGKPCAYIGTLGTGRLPTPDTGGLTTPEVVTMHRLLAQARDEGTRHAVLEASSHALAQARLAEVRVAVAAFTNLTPEHLDYHGDMRAYGAAKLGLFRHPGLRAAVVNVDDPYSEAVLAALPAGVSATRVSIAPAALPGPDRLCAKLMPESGPGLVLVVDAAGRRLTLNSRLVGAFNASNLLVALGMLRALGVDADAAIRALSDARPPPGRMQVFGGAGRKPLVVVDFAHTPDALERALEALRAHRPAAHLTVVFGCGGERDALKRPQMGAIAARLADRVVLTDDNPRGEDPDVILAQIREGIPASASVSQCRDRGQAIVDAVAGAGPEDVVLVAGKGHESVQLVRGDARPFSDEAAVRAALEARP